MHVFAQLVQSLKETHSTHQKIALLIRYFENAPPKDSVWLLGLLTGKRPKGIVSASLLKEWVVESSQIPMWLFLESYYVVGDLAETCVMLLPKPSQAMTESTLSEVISHLLALKNKSVEDKKSFVQGMWNRLDKPSLLVFNKLMTGGFRMGVSDKIIAKALAVYSKKSIQEVLLSLSGAWSPEEITDFNQLLACELSENISRPYPFCLATSFEMDLQDKVSIDSMLFERKFDGMRGQIIKRNNQVFIWSRGEELIHNTFPELTNAAMQLPDGVVLDGEILVWNEAQGCVADFSALQKRINKKKPSMQLLNQYPAIFIGFDCLEYEGNSQTEKPLKERRELLLALSKEWDTRYFSISPVYTFSDWNEVLAQKDKGMQDEGWMIKKADSLYEQGRRAGVWWKWKKAPLVLDCVLLYAQKGHGRRANLYSDFTFAVRNNEVLLPIAKAYSGLSKEELKEVSAFIQKHTLQHFGPVRTVEPILVFEIAFEGIHISSRHKSGVAVRFPRISRWRKDKTVKDISTIEEVKSLLKTN